jgi:hypothetical protein
MKKYFYLLWTVVLAGLLLFGPWNRTSGLQRGGPALDERFCADVNGDGTVNISDAVHLLNNLFKGGKGPWCYSQEPSLPERVQSLEAQVEELKGQMGKCCPERSRVSLYAEKFAATANTYTAIPFAIVQEDTRGEFDLTTHVYKPKEEGTYFLRLSLQWGEAGSLYNWCGIYVNEDGKAWDFESGAAERLTHCSVIAHLKVEDSVTGRVDPTVTNDTVRWAQMQIVRLY